MPRGEKEKRQQTILMRLLRDGRVNTHDLSTEFGITDVAIRSVSARVTKALVKTGSKAPPCKSAATASCSL